MAKEREDAENGLLVALKGQYPHVEPPQDQKLTNETAAFFKKVVDLKKLAADANIFFPVEFENAVPKMIKRAFLKAAKDAED